MAGIKYWVWLSEREGLPRRMALLLLEHFGSPENVYYADAEEYLHVEGMTRQLAERLEDKSTAEADRILGECERLGLRVLTMQDADYPVRLRNIYEPPCLLYVLGRLPEIDEEAAIAMVGTRSATPYGVKVAEEMAYTLARQGALIVSGAAYGIDSASHRGALRAGAKTVAVLGCGIDVVYPSGNGQLYRDIAAVGALMSEYPPGTPAIGAHFPVRNRIISGLCVATLVVEAPERSGALITANTALEQGREVFAVPGPIDAPMSRGCNRLIADGAAALAAGSLDILRELEARYPHKLHIKETELPKTLGSRPKNELSAEKRKKADRDDGAGEERAQLPKLDLGKDGAGFSDDQICVLRKLAEGELQSDDLIEAVGLPTRRVLSALTMLQVDGYVTDNGGKRFSLNVELIG
ncbi:MAG: DNA-processing protein DprA [Oscillospiraceae bacterium]|nr:DNA-processing protein DprA [Oscillospiraceae bacterium]